MSRIPCLNKDGLIEMLGEVELRHRPDCRKATAEEAARPGKGVPTGKAPSPSVATAERVAMPAGPTVPDMLHQVKSAKSREEVQALMNKYANVTDVQKVGAKVLEEMGPAASAKPVNHDPDNLLEIKGLGPAVKKALEGADITTFKALANALPEDLREIIPATVSPKKIEVFQEQARQKVA